MSLHRGRLCTSVLNCSISSPLHSLQFISPSITPPPSLLVLHPPLSPKCHLSPSCYPGEAEDLLRREKTQPPQDSVCFNNVGTCEAGGGDEDWQHQERRTENLQCIQINKSYITRVSPAERGGLKSPQSREWHLQGVCSFLEEQDDKKINK